MLTSQNKKNKIQLTDYNYRRDIENRLLMSQFSVAEVEVLEEIVDGALRIPVAELIEDTGIDRAEMTPILEKLSKTGLFTLQDDLLTVSKEMRKYFEFQILKFDDDFKPDMQFLQGLLRKIPISVLPAWYATPKTSDNIIDSIVQKNLLTPKIYTRYLEELCFEDPVFNGIIEDVFSSPDLKIRSRTLREKYSLTRELFEEYMLHLEFNFVCCLHYNRIDDHWKEVVTPFKEWRDYITFSRESVPQEIPESNIQRFHPEDFGFVQDMEILLNHGRGLELPLSEESVAPLLEQSKVNPLDISPKSYFEMVLQKSEELGFIETSTGEIDISADANDWLEMSHQDRAGYLHRHPLYGFYELEVPQDLMTEKNIRIAERSLGRVIDSGWITIQDFLRGLVDPVGTAEEVTLKKQGKKWRYVIPEYSEDERMFIELVIWERMFQLGMVDIGYHDGQRCFRVSEFGKDILRTS